MQVAGEIGIDAIAFGSASKEFTHAHPCSPMRTRVPPSLDPATEHAARAFLEKVAGRYEVIGAIVLGSRARRNHRADSDADVAVLLRGQRPDQLERR